MKSTIVIGFRSNVNEIADAGVHDRKGGRCASCMALVQLGIQIIIIIAMSFTCQLIHVHVILALESEPTFHYWIRT